MVRTTTQRGSTRSVIRSARDGAAAAAHGEQENNQAADESQMRVETNVNAVENPPSAGDQAVARANDGQADPNAENPADPGTSAANLAGGIQADGGRQATSRLEIQEVKEVIHVEDNAESTQRTTGQRIITNALLPTEPLRLANPIRRPTDPSPQRILREARIIAEQVDQHGVVLRKLNELQDDVEFHSEDGPELTVPLDAFVKAFQCILDYQDIRQLYGLIETRYAIMAVLAAVELHLGLSPNQINDIYEPLYAVWQRVQLPPVKEWVKMKWSKVNLEHFLTEWIKSLNELNILGPRLLTQLSSMMKKDPMLLLQTFKSFLPAIPRNMERIQNLVHHMSQNPGINGKSFIYAIHNSCPPSIIIPTLPPVAASER
jgi:hypothetical protein